MENDQKDSAMENIIQNWRNPWYRELMSELKNFIASELHKHCKSRWKNDSFF